jgi:glyceraldehyde 3-phosphate dehydrogenase
MNIAINGFGRIGKNFLRALLQDAQAQSKIHVVAINLGPTSVEHVALLFKYDSVLGTYQDTVEVVEGYLCVGVYRIKLLNCMEPADAHWTQYHIDWVVDCSGRFTTAARARLHLDAGARYVLISAPATGEDVAIIPGVNDRVFDAKKHHIISLGSCTTNALLPMLKVLKKSCGLQEGFMTTVHAYTNSQPLVDDDRHDIRQARAAGINIIPTSTGASKMVGKIIPELEGKIKASSLRVPVAKVSYIDVTFTSNLVLSVDLIITACRQAADGDLRGILDITMDPLVSSDFYGNNNSVVIDGLSVNVIGSMGKICGWYDNEWAYSVRLKDFLLMV